MSMRETLQRFTEQFDWEPAIEHNEALRGYKYYSVVGMGGSHLGAWLIKRYERQPNVFIHRNYGIPETPEEIRADSLVILSSYSGTTEEILDAGRECMRAGRPLAAIATGGKLLEFAREHALPHIQIPETGLEPRMALGFSMLGLSKLMMNTVLEERIRSAGKSIDPMRDEHLGMRIGDMLRGKIPLVYASAANTPLSFIWKIKFNETSKIPAFCNVFPEMNHNELSGFDTTDSTKELSARMHAIFLEDTEDHPRIRERMRVAGDVLFEHGIPVERVALRGSGLAKALESAIVADFASLSLAEYYGVPNPDTPLIADFKRRIGT